MKQSLVEAMLEFLFCFVVYFKDALDVVGKVLSCIHLKDVLRH